METMGMTGSEMRVMSPTKDMLHQSVDVLVSLGWKFKTSRRHSADAFEGWWINENHPTKNRPIGDSKNFYIGAWGTVKTYIAI